MAKKWFVIDTSVYLSDSECLTRFDNNDMPNGKSYKFNDNYFYDKLNYSSWKFQK